MSVFNKPARTVTYQVDQWVDRGLLIPDRARAERYLSSVGYFRLSAYTLPFQTGNPNHNFKPGSGFQDVLDLYIFDRQLRLLVMDAIERIEVSIRAHFNNHMSLNHGSHWYLLWNRELGNAPKVPHKLPASWVQMPIKVADPKVDANKRLYLMLVILEFLLKQVNPGSSWHERLYCLIKTYPKVSRPHMGMPENWDSDPFWHF